MDKLRDKFLEHAEKADRERKEWVQAYLDNYPGEPLTEHLVDDFNLPRALAQMCDEIQKLKDARP